jgi:pyridoxine/pyridoxamine 5'-phosphate oxidase
MRLVVATATPDGKPSARVVLCKKLIVSPGYVVFFTNYESRKGKELAQIRTSQPCCTGTNWRARCGSKVASCAARRRE